MPGSGNDPGGVDLMKKVQDLDVREIGKALQRIGVELLGQIDPRFLPSPEIVLRMRPGRGNEANRMSGVARIEFGTYPVLSAKS